ncbi:hypothetical protein D8771_21070 [Streptomyces albus]|uniref:Uncharacterized protein n=1 Tax=Streptomyces albus TaxID=1888 RepID=A0A8H1QN73_9ACTN|nr:hypothetical protein ADL27_46870 [Streptomyces sp. NRRL F-6602]TGG80321.1 hypothetical protein D8771_21070 [Streptomyces albus]GHJ24922.1 hypothetical protein TPA0909_65360 [Streptomyces albus]
MRDAVTRPGRTGGEPVAGRRGDDVAGYAIRLRGRAGRLPETGRTDARRQRGGDHANGETITESN